MSECTIESIHTSRHAIGAPVIVNGTVRAVHFTESKVNYIVEIGGHLFNVDSCDVNPAKAAEVQA